MSIILGDIQQAYYTAAQWSAWNGVLLAGQKGIESDTKKEKVGDGVTVWNSLTYSSVPAQNLNNVLSVGSSTSGQDMTITADDQIKMGAGNAVIFNDSTEVDSNHIFLSTNSTISGYSHIFLKDGGNEFHDESASAYISLQAGSPPSCSISLDHSNNGKIDIFNGTGGLNLNGATYFPNLTASTVPYLDANNKITSSAVTPTELGLLSGLTGFTGSGTLLAKGTSPTFTTDITTPLIIGGSAVGSTIQYKGTTANGTSTVAAHQFLVGNNGATTAASIYNSGQVNIGNYASPTNLRLVTIGQDTAFLSIGSRIGTTSQVAFYANQATPSATNYSMLFDQSDTYFSAPSTSGSVLFQIGSSTRINLSTNRMTFAWAAATSGAITSFSVTTPAHTGQDASTEIPNFRITGATKTWNTGALATQRFNLWTANTAAANGASTFTAIHNGYFEAPVAGTNVTATNLYALGIGGHCYIANSVGVPSNNPTGGGILYVESGALKYRGSSGTVTILGAA